MILFYHNIPWWKPASADPGNTLESLNINKLRIQLR